MGAGESGANPIGTANHGIGVGLGYPFDRKQTTLYVAPNRKRVPTYEKSGSVDVGH